MRPPSVGPRALLTMNDPAVLIDGSALHQNFPELRTLVHVPRSALSPSSGLFRRDRRGALGGRGKPQLGGIVLTSVGASREDAARVIAQFRQGGYAVSRGSPARG